MPFTPHRADSAQALRAQDDTPLIKPVPAPCSPARAGVPELPGHAGPAAVPAVVVVRDSPFFRAVAVFVAGQFVIAAFAAGALHACEAVALNVGGEVAAAVSRQSDDWRWAAVIALMAAASWLSYVAGARQARVRLRTDQIAKQEAC